MTLDEALTHWRRERERLADLDAWVEAGYPPAPPPLRPSLAEYARLRKPDAKRAIKRTREELAKDAFLRMFSAFEGEMRAVFAEWLRRKCGAAAASHDIDAELPAMEGVLRIAAVLEPRFDPSRAGYVSNVRDTRNRLVHGGFASPMAYDLEDLHRRLAEVVALFRT